MQIWFFYFPIKKKEKKRKERQNIYFDCEFEKKINLEKIIICNKKKEEKVKYFYAKLIFKIKITCITL